MYPSLALLILNDVTKSYWVTDYKLLELLELLFATKKKIEMFGYMFRAGDKTRETEQSR